VRHKAQGIGPRLATGFRRLCVGVSNPLGDGSGLRLHGMRCRQQTAPAAVAVLMPPGGESQTVIA
jgi:hypothetical protein